MALGGLGSDEGIRPARVRRGGRCVQIPLCPQRWILRPPRESFCGLGGRQAVGRQMNGLHGSEQAPEARLRLSGACLRSGASGLR